MTKDIAGKSQRRELEGRLARCRELQRDFKGVYTAKNLRELTAEIEQETRALEK